MPSAARPAVSAHPRLSGIRLLPVALALLLAAPLAARAEAPLPDEGEAIAATDFAGQDRLTLPGALLGGGLLVLDEEGGSARTFTSLGVRSELAVWQLRIGLRLALRLDDDLEVRREDWDEPSDWPGFVDFVELGRPGDALHARLGRLHGVTLGHGTLLAHYQSAIDYDSQKVGLSAGVALEGFGVEVVANDVTSWEVLGGRIYLDPLGGLGVPLVRSLRLSVQAALDREAPTELKLGPDGAPRLDSDGNLRYESDPLVGVGVGAELPLGLGPLGLVPYVDVNHLSGKGTGLHVGADARLRFELLGGLGVKGGAELRVTRSGYLPAYFDGLYEVDRYSYPERDSPETKRAALDGAAGQLGWLARAGLELPFVEASASFSAEVEDPESNRLVVGAELTGLPRLRARALWVKHGVDGPGEVFDLDERTTLVIEALIELFPHLYVDLAFTRSYRVDEDTGRYRAVDSYAPAAYLGFSF